MRVGWVVILRFLTGNRVDGDTSPEMGSSGGEEVGGKLWAVLGFSCLGWAVRRQMEDKSGAQEE